MIDVLELCPLDKAIYRGYLSQTCDFRCFVKQKRSFHPRNSRRLVSLLSQVRLYIFKKSRPVFAKKLLATARKTSDENYNFNGSSDAIVNIETGCSEVTFFHIEMYARMLNIPSWVILLASRLQRSDPVAEIEIAQIVIEKIEQISKDKQIPDDKKSAELLLQVSRLITERYENVQVFTDVDSSFREKDPFSRPQDRVVISKRAQILLDTFTDDKISGSNIVLPNTPLFDDARSRVTRKLSTRTRNQNPD